MKPVIIIGGGISGISCARELAKRGVPFLLIESSSHLGGRMSSELIDGYIIDKGFHAFNPSYPELKRLSREELPELHPFARGAICKTEKGFFTFRSRLVSPFSFFQALLSGNLKVRDLLAFSKMGLASLLSSKPPFTSAGYLAQQGFSDSILNNFLQPFFAGVFLDDNLSAPAHHLLFCLRHFILGGASLPHKGILNFPQRLSATLPPTSLRLATKVIAINKDSVVLESEESIPYSYVVMAASPSTTLKGENIALSPEWQNTTWHGAHYFYFRTTLSHPFLKGNLIGLCGDRSKVIRNLIPYSGVNPSYAPQGSHLLSVVTLPALPYSPNEVLTQVRHELKEWFQETPFNLITHFPVTYGLPDSHYKSAYCYEDIIYCGDFCAGPSVNGALLSGRQAAAFIP